jgi:hypothetical protein
MNWGMQKLFELFEKNWTHTLFALKWDLMEVILFLTVGTDKLLRNKKWTKAMYEC